MVVTAWISSILWKSPSCPHILLSDWSVECDIFWKKLPSSCHFYSLARRSTWWPYFENGSVRPISCSWCNPRVELRFLSSHWLCIIMCFDICLFDYFLKSLRNIVSFSSFPYRVQLGLAWAGAFSSATRFHWILRATCWSDISNVNNLFELPTSL
jgi:hypothetical protein